MVDKVHSGAVECSLSFTLNEQNINRGMAPSHLYGPSKDFTYCSIHRQEQHPCIPVDLVLWCGAISAVWSLSLVFLSCAGVCESLFCNFSVFVLRILNERL
jgi:hypothetical protein